MTGPLEGKIIILVGSAEPLASAVSTRLTRAGATVLQVQFQSGGNPAESVKKRFFIRSAKQAAVHDVMHRLRGTSVFVHGAVVLVGHHLQRGAFLSRGDEAWLQAERETREVALGLQGLIGRMLETGGGKIVTLLGAFGDRKRSGPDAPYQLVLDAAESLTRSVSRELGASLVRVNGIRVGAISWDSLEEQSEGGTVALPDEDAELVAIGASWRTERGRKILAQAQAESGTSELDLAHLRDALTMPPLPPAIADHAWRSPLTPEEIAETALWMLTQDGLNGQILQLGS